MAATLKRIADFEKVLKSYAMSQEGKRILAETTMVVMTGVTASGRNTTIRELLETDQYYFIISDTTRPPRENKGVMEEHGKQYFFRTEDDLLADLMAGAFLEAAIIHRQQVSGISLREIEVARDTGKIAITDMDVQGAETIMKAKPDAKPIFMLPPSYKEWMRRITERGGTDTQEIRRRLQSAEVELERAIKDDYFLFVINDDLAQAVTDVRDIAEHGHYTHKHSEAGQAKAWELLNHLKADIHS